MVESPVVARHGLLSGVLRRRWALLLLLTLLGGAAGAAAGAVLPTTYTSTASLFLEPTSGNPFSPSTAATRNEQIAALQTEVALVPTADVTRLARTVETDLPEDAADHVSAAVPSNSQVIDVSYTAPDPERARAGAQAYATAFLQYRQERSDRVVEEQTGVLQDQLDDTSALLDQATTQLETTSLGTARYVQLQQQVQLYASQFSDLQVQVLALASAAANPGEVISPAQPPTAPDGLPPLVLVAAGLVAGLVAGGLLGLYREHRDPRLHTLTDVAQLGTGPALARLGAGPVDASSAEGHRTLEATVLGALPRSGGVLALVGADAGAVSDEVVRGLAGALVGSGHTCTVVTSEPVPGVPDAGVTLRQVVRAAAAADAAPDDDRAGLWTAAPLGVQVEPRLTLVAASEPGDDTSGTDLEDLFQNERTHGLIRDLAASGQVVLVSTPPLPRGSALSLARHADRAVLIVRMGRTSYDVAAGGVEQLVRSGASVLGTVAVADGPARRGRLHAWSSRRRRGPSAGAPVPVALQEHHPAAPLGGWGPDLVPDGTAAPRTPSPDLHNV